MFGPVTIFTDRYGDKLSVIPRNTHEFGNPIPDPVLSVSKGRDTSSVVFTEDEFREMLKAMAKEVLGEDWGQVPKPATVEVISHNHLGSDRDLTMTYKVIPMYITTEVLINGEPVNMTGHSFFLDCDGALTTDSIKESVPWWFEESNRDGEYTEVVIGD